jgi:hypothetical protein
MKVTPKMRVITAATLHYHDWTPGTPYWEFEHEVRDMYRTARDFSQHFGMDGCSFTEYKLAMLEAGQAAE